MTIYFEPFKHSDLNIKDFKARNKKDDLKRVLRETLSAITLAERFGVPLWRVKALFEHHGLYKESMPVKCMFMPDIHWDHEDKQAYSIFKQYLKSKHWDVFLSLGDFDNCESISHHNKGKAKFAMRDVTLRYDEMEYCKKELKVIERLIGPKCQKIAMYGNHDIRPWKYYEEHPAAEKGWDYLEWMQKRGWKCYPETVISRIGNLHFTHSTFQNKYFANKTVLTYGTDMIVGHVHTLQCDTIEVQGVPVTAWSGMMLYNQKCAKRDYIKNRTRWRLGFIDAWIDLITGIFSPSIHFIDNRDDDYKMMADGVIWTP